MRAFLLLAVCLCLWSGQAAASQGQDAATPAEEYGRACAACHAADGRGQGPSIVGFETPLPDFTDCSFASREPDADWFAIAHEGGPVRGFARMMPAFGEALTTDEIQATLDHIRTFCDEGAWPRGELNLPRALVTEKAYPEDEAVLTTTVAVEGAGGVSNELLYERRFGPRNQIEVAVPFELAETGGEWAGGVGDIALALKRAVWHSLESGSILSVAGEVVLPTGDADEGTGKGFTVFEPFVAFGQILPADGFFQAQAGLEVPLDRDHADEVFWRAVVGRSFAQGTFGRTWSPMIELLGVREIEDEAGVEWDVVPQVQVTLNTRQHVMLSGGVRVPLGESAGRGTQVMVYVLWDWFDGGFFDGW